ncbi:gamma-glutamyltransferase family protein [Halosegnis longus]|uniref:Gamma-glutamyltransferase family protein n=1 Tax=Halosegnis longus TaxID=2216012 RepID=A0AAJ4R6W1_9EURY|nr:gamma-glutamyltransferase family protein [Halosegnis longus]RNJ25300.1 gamma-glutamyltransferase family protein [Salella cibi]
MDNEAVDGFGSRRSTVYGSEGMVATSQPLAATAGLETLEAGGNAFDAAVATAAALNVVEPTSTGLGGDVFALYRTADGEVGAMRSCGGAPANATRQTVREAVADEDEDPSEAEMPMLGPQTVTVPGTARGWEATTERFGERSLGENLQHAIRYATEGYPVSPVIADAWSYAEDLFDNENARNAYLVDGERAPEAGEHVTLDALGATLETIAEEGADAVYEGEIGEQIVEEVQEAGGFLTMDDLTEFEPEFPDPVSTSYNGTEVYELPPNNQGLIVLEALNIASELGASEAEGTERVHLFVEALKRAFHDGHRYITDPDYEELPPLNSAEWASERASDVEETAGDVEFMQRTGEDADTVLLCVADDEGNVVSYINSRFAGFGSGLVAGDTGIALQNRGASFSLDDDHPNRFEPGKRPFHTLIPGLIDFAPDTEEEEDWAAFGVMGGFMQPQGHLQTVTSLVDDGLTPQQALDRPRWRYREDGRLAVEARFPTETQNGLLRRGHDLAVLPPIQFGGAQFVRRNADGVLSGATEPRKDGNAVGR